MGRELSEVSWESSFFLVEGEGAACLEHQSAEERHVWNIKPKVFMRNLRLGMSSVPRLEFLHIAILIPLHKEAINLDSFIREIVPLEFLTLFNFFLSENDSYDCWRALKCHHSGIFICFRCGFTSFLTQSVSPSYGSEFWPVLIMHYLRLFNIAWT